MKIIRLSKNNILFNLKSNVKIMILIFLSCVAIGLVIGVLNAKSYDPSESLYKNELETPINLSDIDKDGAYYFNAFYKLKQKSDYLNAYLDYFSQVYLTAESKELLLVMEERLEKYDVNNLKSSMAFFKTTPLCLGNMENETIAFYLNQQKALIKQLTIKENKLKNYEDMDLSDETILSKKETIEGNISQLNEEISLYNYLIQLIQDEEPNELATNAAYADQLLDENFQEMNIIVEEFNGMLSTISKQESYEIVYNKRILKKYEDKSSVKVYNALDEKDIMNNTVNRAIIYARSIEGLDIPKERFFATITFFILFGIIVTVLIGAFYTKKEI